MNRTIDKLLFACRIVEWSLGYDPIEMETLLYGDIREREGTLTVSGHVSYDSFIVYPTSIFIWVLLVSQIIVLLCHLTHVSTTLS